jgi:DNA-binding NtrC family response regulator
MDNNSENDLDDAIIGQSDLSEISGKSIVLAIPQEDENRAFADLFKDMDLQVHYAASAAEILQNLEDHPAHLLVMDMQMPDIHAWKMISKVREIDRLRDLPILIITDQASLGMTVAKVDYLTRPVSIARLRQNILETLNQGAVSDDSASPNEG